MQHTFVPENVCAREIQFEVKDGKLYNVEFKGGCRGNLIGISKLVEGNTVSDVITKLKGIPCRGTTSCPDQLAKALAELG